MNTYSFTRNGIPEEVSLERWCWVATYTDGTILKQFADDGIFHQFSEIDQSKLHVFSMAHEDKNIDLLFDPATMKLIHYYKHYRLNVFTPEETHIKVYVFGFEKHVRGNSVKSLVCILPNDTLCITDNSDNLQV